MKSIKHIAWGMFSVGCISFMAYMGGYNFFDRGAGGALWAICSVLSFLIIRGVSKANE